MGRDDEEPRKAKVREDAAPVEDLALQETGLAQTSSPDERTQAGGEAARHRQSAAGWTSDDERELGAVIVDRFKVIEKIGAGGMGGVYRALDLKTGGHVALKRMAQSLEGDPSLVKRFEQEAELAAKVGHHNVVAVLDVGRDERNRPFYAMELVNGAPLSRIVREQGALPPGRCVHIMRQVAAGLEAIHAAGILHRDLKPANVILVGDDWVKLVDFGVARRVGNDVTELTEKGTIPGTTRYIGPEVLTGATPDERIDVYAAGVLLYVLLTGEEPWHGLTETEMLAAKQGAAVSPAARFDGCPEELDAIVRRATEPDVRRRFASAKELADALLDGPLSELGAGTVIDRRYQVVRKLKQGAQGVLYEVRDNQTRERRALKILLAGTSGNSRERFEREARLGETVAADDPTLVKVVGKGSCGEAWRHRPYFAMELVEGFRPLSEMMHELEWPAFLQIVAQLAKSLDRLARHGVVHRDLKPDHVLVLSDGHVKILDLGLARERDSALTKSSQANMLGTIGYMAPEQTLRAKDAEPASDQWALASIVYAFLTGVSPYEDGADDEDQDEASRKARVVERIVEGEVLRDVRELNESVGEELASAVMRALAREPADRFTWCTDFARALADAPADGLVLQGPVEGYEDGSAAAAPVSPAAYEAAPPAAASAPAAVTVRPRRSQPWLVRGGLGAAVLVAAVIAVVGTRKPETPTPRSPSNDRVVLPSSTPAAAIPPAAPVRQAPPPDPEPSAQATTTTAASQATRKVKPKAKHARGTEATAPSVGAERREIYQNEKAQQFDRLGNPIPDNGKQSGASAPKPGHKGSANQYRRDQLDLVPSQ